VSGRDKIGAVAIGKWGKKTGGNGQRGQVCQARRENYYGGGPIKRLAQDEAGEEHDKERVSGLPSIGTGKVKQGSRHGVKRGLSEQKTPLINGGKKTLLP